MTEASPLVSVVTATYNRSNVLRYTIGSVLDQTFLDWELIVIGDACTDDTEEVVASCNDPRIRFTNLERNVGEQSGPNNEGCSLARGRYIAFLNHDDLWLPDHLEIQLQGIEKSGADLVFTLGISISPAGERILVGAAPGNRYHPSIWVPASLWLAKREMIRAVGPWRSYRECYAIPSQDWLIRAWKTGRDMRSVPKLTAVLVWSGSRPNVYANRDAEENRSLFDRMRTEKDFRENELTGAILDLSAPYTQSRVWTFLRQGVKNSCKVILLRLHLIPQELKNCIRFGGRKGGVIDKLREVRGLSKRR